MRGEERKEVRGKGRAKIPNGFLLLNYQVEWERERIRVSGVERRMRGGLRR